MLRKFGIRLPSNLNIKLSNHIKEYHIVLDVNKINMGKFDIFTIGVDSATHVRLANINGKWLYTILKPSILVGGEGEELVRVAE